MSVTTLTVFNELQLSEDAESKDIEDFYGLLGLEVKKINNFFTGKVEEIQSSIENIIQHRTNVFRVHHTGSDLVTDLKNLRSAYIELSALNSYVDFNETGNL